MTGKWGHSGRHRACFFGSAGAIPTRYAESCMRLVLVMLTFVPGLFAQSSVSGSIQGTVVDATGFAVSGVRVLAKAAGSGNSRTAETGNTGQFLLSALPIGEYSLTFSKEGFTTATRSGIQVSVGQTATQRITLTVAMLSQQLDVTEGSDALQTAASSASVALGGERVEEAPAKKRNNLTFMLTAPSTTPAPGSNASQSTAATRNVANESSFVTTGMRGRNNSISIDGVDNRDET